MGYLNDIQDPLTTDEIYFYWLFHLNQESEPSISTQLSAYINMTLKVADNCISFQAAPERSINSSIERTKW